MTDIEKLAAAYEEMSMIVHLQSEVIDGLFRILAMHLSADELNALEVTDKIIDASRRTKKWAE